MRQSTNLRARCINDSKCETYVNSIQCPKLLSLRNNFPSQAFLINHSTIRRDTNASNDSILITIISGVSDASNALTITSRKRFLQHESVMSTQRGSITHVSVAQNDDDDFIKTQQRFTLSGNFHFIFISAAFSGREIFRRKFCHLMLASRFSLLPYIFLHARSHTIFTSSPSHTAIICFHRVSIEKGLTNEKAN